MGDWDGSKKSGWGGIENGGTFSGKPSINEILIEAPTIDGFKPPNGCSVMQKWKLRPQDGHYGVPGSYSTGYRILARQGEPIPMRGPGYESYLIFPCMMTKSYPGGANMWVMPMEIHQSSPGGVTGVAPSHLIFDGSGLSFDVRGGPTKQAGGIGNPGSKNEYSAHYPINEREVWHIPVLYYRHGAGDGAFQLFYAQVGKDKELRALTPLVTGKFTMFKDLLDYVLLGGYRQDSGSGDTEFYTAGSEEKVKKEDMLAWVHTMLGTPVVDPDPGPTPPPPGPITEVVADASIKSGAHLAAGTRYTIMVDTVGVVAKMRFYFDGKEFDEDTGGPTRGGRFVTGLDLTTATVGTHKFGFASIAPDGSEIASATFKSYDIVVDPKVVVKTAAQHREDALVFLSRTTESYTVWNKRTPAKKVGTNWAKGLAELAQIT